MNRKYLLNEQKKAAWYARVLAKGIDIFIAVIISIFLYPVGVLVGAAYIAFSDTLQNGQSVGKKFIGFAVISLEDGMPCSFKQSVIRNLPIVVPLVFSIFPIWGWILTVIIGVPMMILELYLMMKIGTGNRLGDVMADTTVIAPTGGQKIENKRSSSWYENNTGVS